MDIVAHALWTMGGAVAVRQRFQSTIRIGWATFWGIFPDLFSFAIPAVVRIWWFASGVTSSLLPNAQSGQHFQYVWQLYYFSHSLVVFAMVFGIVWVSAKRPILELLGWGLHILIDIPTHEGMFAPHFLWPFSSYGVSGIRWENHWFQALNYCALGFVCFWMWVQRVQRKAGGQL